MARGKTTPEKEREAVIRSVCRLLAKGLDIKNACRAIAFPETTFYTWVDKDEAVRIRTAAAEYEYFIEMHDSVQRGAKENPQLALQVLSKRMKDLWSDRTEVTGKDGEPLAFGIKDMFNAKPTN